VLNQALTELEVNGLSPHIATDPFLHLGVKLNGQNHLLKGIKEVSANRLQRIRQGQRLLHARSLVEDPG
jgi:hypothetical protein